MRIAKRVYLIVLIVKFQKVETTFKGLKDKQEYKTKTEIIKAI